MNYETFENRYKEGIYKKEDKFWVCDVVDLHNNLKEKFKII